MPIKISDDFMCLEIDSQVIATASQAASRRLVGSQPLAPVLRPQPGNHSPDDHRTPRQRTRQQ
jgi:hypothetical protein